jgi:hypothetical protein
MVMRPDSKIGEVRVGKLAANMLSCLLTVLFCAAGVAIAHVLPHHIPDATWNLFAFLASVVVLVVVHEALHGVGLLKYAKVSRRDIRFGFMWRGLVPYCHCKVPISVGAYRRMALLPLWVTGTTTFVLLLLFPADWLGLLAGISVAACVGDVWLVARLRRFSSDLFVQDSPSEIGCDVYSAIN